MQTRIIFKNRLFSEEITREFLINERIIRTNLLGLRCYGTEGVNDSQVFCILFREIEKRDRRFGKTKLCQAYAYTERHKRLLTIRVGVE